MLPVAEDNAPASAGVVRIEKVIDCRSGASALWPIVTDSDRLNRAIGLGALVVEPYENEGGARYLRRAVQRLVESPLSEAILRKEVREGDRVHLRDDDGRILARRVSA